MCLLGIPATRHATREVARILLLDDERGCALHTPHAARSSVPGGGTGRRAGDWAPPGRCFQRRFLRRRLSWLWLGRRRRFRRDKLTSAVTLVGWDDAATPHSRGHGAGEATHPPGPVVRALPGTDRSPTRGTPAARLSTGYSGRRPGHGVTGTTPVSHSGRALKACPRAPGADSGSHSAKHSQHHGRGLCRVQAHGKNLANATGGACPGECHTTTCYL